MTDVLLVDAIDQLEPYRGAWQELLDQTEGGSFFQSLDWLEIYWRHFGAGQQIRVLIVLEQGKPSGIVPLTVLSETTRAGQIRVLTYPLHDWGTFYGPIGPNAGATLSAALQLLRTTPRNWDLLDLRWIDRRSDRGQTAEAMCRAGFYASEHIWNRTAVIDTRTDWDCYIAARAPKFRNNLRRLHRRLSELGEITYERFRPARCAEADPRWDLFDRCVELAQRSWQGQSTNGTTLSHRSVQPFFRQCHAAAVRLGMVDLNLLRVDGQPAAFGYGYCHGGYVYGTRIGYAPEFSQAGAGNVLQMLTLQDSMRRGDHTFDFGPGSLQLKRHWITRLDCSYRCTHYRIASPRVQLLRLKHWWERRAAAQQPQPADDHAA